MTPAVRAKFQAVENQNTSLNKKLEEEKAARLEEQKARETATREAAIRTEIANYKLREHCGDLAFNNIVPSVSRTDDGSLVAGPENQQVPLVDFVKTFFTEGAGAVYVEPTKTGSGATGDGAPAGGGTVQLEGIKPGMSKDDKRAAWREVQRQAGVTG